MFDQFKDAQSFADAVKRIVLESGAPPRYRRTALKVINRFEGSEWRPELMQQIADEQDRSFLTLMGDGQLIYNQPDDPPQFVVLVIADMLLDYISALWFEERGLPQSERTGR